MTFIPDNKTRRALEQLENNGSDLSKPLEIDFFVAVPSEDKGHEVALKAQNLGFKISVEQDLETKDWTCYCTKTIIPKYSTIIDLEQQLSFISKPHRGYIDGFGSYGNSSL